LKINTLDGSEQDKEDDKFFGVDFPIEVDTGEEVILDPLDHEDKSKN
jgi:hypothetical protein